MTQLGMGVAALNHDSQFAAAYEKGIKKSEYWTHTLEDCINLIARLPALAARIYRNVYKPGTPIVGINKDLDLVGKQRDVYLVINAFLTIIRCRQLRQHAWIRP